jgi:hypothetical protein
MRRTIKAALTMAVGTMTALAVAAPAAAYIDGDYNTSGVRIRRTPSTSDNRIDGLGYPGQGARVWCWTTGSTVSGSNIWSNNTDRATSVRGYSWDGYLNWSGVLGQC